VNPFGFLEEPLDKYLTFLNEQVHLTYGWAIVVLTITVRIAILPLFISQYRSGRRMQEIAPLVKQVQAKHKGDKRKQQEEMMRLFQEHKVNPFGSCLPIVFQIPIFIALYYVLRNFSQEQTTGDLSFMWIIPDISEQFRDLGWAAVVMAVIYGLSQLLATEVSMATQPQTADWQRKLFRVMPLFIVAGLFFYPNIPAGLVLYWMTTNLWTCGQQVVLKRRLGPLNLVTVPLTTEEPAGAVKPAKVAKPAQEAKPAQDVTPAPPAKTARARPVTESTEAATGAEGNGSGRATPKKPRPKGGTQSQRRRPPRKR
jgi:YidC/Oxa1 family membrane protein insertase